MLRRVLIGCVVAVWMMAAAGAQARTAAVTAEIPPAEQTSLQSLAGRYRGTAATEYGPSEVTAEIRVSEGVITGTMTSTYGPLTVTGGSLTGEALTLNLDMDGRAGSVTALYRGGKIEGQWRLGTDSGTFTMSRVAEPSATPSGESGSAVADPLTGDWNATIDAGGNQTAFTISIRLDGEKVTGQMGSERGSVPFEGRWTNGTLTLNVAMPNGAFTMTGTLNDATLVGTFSFGDAQFTGGWTAERRK